jgi:hypothetical protein
MRYVWLIETDSLGRFDPNNPLAYNVVMNEFQRIFRSEVFKQYAAIVTVLALAAFWLASCSPSSGEKPLLGDGGGTPTLPLPDTETSTATATSTETPTATSAPTPTEIPFSPETWAGTDEKKMGFVANVKEWGVDPDSYTCGEGGKCFDLEGNVIFESGKYDLHFAQRALASSGVLGGPQVAPGAGGRIKSTDVNKLNIESGLAYEVLENDLMENSDIQLIPDGKIAVFNYMLLDPNSNLWGYVVGYKDQNSPVDEKSYKYLAFIKNDGKTVDWIQIKPSSSADIINYWASQG